MIRVGEDVGGVDELVDTAEGGGEGTDGGVGDGVVGGLTEVFGVDDKVGAVVEGGGGGGLWWAEIEVVMSLGDELVGLINNCFTLLPTGSGP